ncbi:MAG TPA: Rieske 2Fe-2S domain-containing protein [Alphaproteobacteria bacterium]|nr:Rieske 2Fe-2S domain-containing protein [Alphaproteobacteria bacterium]
MTPQENELLTRIGPGTRMGAVMRRYWWPIGYSQEVGSIPLPVRLLGEDLILFRAGNGKVGLVAQACAHRLASLEHGRVEQNGIRCCYHGWLYDMNGQCVEMPAEPDDNQLCKDVKIAGYRTEELGGLVFAYMGPEPAPLLPNYDLLVREDCDRQLSSAREHCNWLQRAENGVDKYHSMALHAPVYPTIALKRPEQVKWDQTWYGFRMSAKYPGKTENVSHCIFPSHTRRYGARVGERPSHYLHLRVPVDDIETITFFVRAQETADGKPGKVTVKPHENLPRGVYEHVEDGWWRLTSHEQDRAAQESQGLITDRTKEFLATSDRGIVQLRKLLLESVDNVEAGKDPFGLLRDPALNQIVSFDAQKNFADTDKDFAGNKADPSRELV